MNLEEQRLLGKSMQSSWSPIFQTGTGNRLKGELITERSKAEQKDWLPLRSCWHFSTNYLLFSIAGSLQCHARAWRPGRYGPARALGPGADIRPGDPFCWQALKEVQEAKEGGGGSSPDTHCEARGRNSTGAHRCLELVHQGNLKANCTLLPDSFFFFFRGRKRSQASTWGTFWGSWVRTPLRMTSLQWWWRSVAHPLEAVQKIADKEKLTGSTIWQRQLYRLLWHISSEWVRNLCNDPVFWNFPNIRFLG